MQARRTKRHSLWDQLVPRQRPVGCPYLGAHIWGLDHSIWALGKGPKPGPVWCAYLEVTLPGKVVFIMQSPLSPHAQRAQV